MCSDEALAMVNAYLNGDTQHFWENIDDVLTGVTPHFLNIFDSDIDGNF